MTNRERLMVGSTVEVEHQLRHGHPCKDGVTSQLDQPSPFPPRNMPLIWFNIHLDHACVWFKKSTQDFPGAKSVSERVLTFCPLT